MADLSIKLKTEAEAQSFNKSVEQLSSKAKPVKIKIEADVSKSLANLDKTLGPLSSQISSTYKRLAALRAEGSLNEKTFNQLTKRVDEVRGSLEKGNTTFAKGSKALDDITNEADGVKQGFLGISQGLSEAVSKFTVWYLIAGAVSGLINKLKDVVVQVKALDDALVELNKVTNLTKSQLKDVTQVAFDLGEQVGKTGTDVLGAITSFARAGYTLEQSTDLAKYALMMTNVAEGINDAGTASDYFISILKGANLDISYAGTLLDELNEISNTSAINFDNLADMTQRIAGTMHTLGNSIRETESLITGAYEVLQDERVAKGISTIGLRISGLNEDLEREAGLQSSINDALQKYAKGISVFDKATGQLRSTYDILEDLSGVWDTLDKNAQAYLTTTLAGKNRADVLAAILTNWEGVEHAMTAAINSAGSALQEQQAYLDSIEGKQQALANAWQELATNTLNSDFVKTLIDITTWFVKLVDACGGLIPLLTTILGLVIAFKAQKIASGISSLIQGIKGLAAGFTSLNSALGIIGLIATGISLLVGVINGITSAVEANNQAIEESRKKTIETAQEQREKLSDLQDEYTTLYNKVNKTEEENARLLAIQKSLVENYGQLKDGIDAVNGSYEDYIDLIGIASEEEARKELAAMSKDVVEAQKTLSGVSTKKITLRDFLGGKSETRDLLNKYFGGDFSWLGTDWESVPEFLGLSKEQIQGKSIEEIYNALTQKYEQLSSKQVAGILTEEANQLSKVTSLIDVYDKVIQNANDTLEREAELKKYINNEIAKETDETKEQKEQLKELQAQIRRLINYNEEYNDSLSEILAAKKAQNEEDEKSEELNEKLLAVEKARQELAEARTKRVRVFRAGVGFTYESDTAAVQEAQESLQEKLDDLADYNFDIAYNRAQDFIDKLNTLLSSDNIVDGWQNLFEEFGDLLDSEFAEYLIKADEFIKQFANKTGVDFPNTNTLTTEITPSISPQNSTTSSGANISVGSATTPAPQIASVGTNITLQFNGPLEFPNVSSAEDASGFIDAVISVGNSRIPKYA